MAYEMYDYLSTIAPDYAYTLNIQPHSQLIEEGQKNVHVKEYDDGSETRIVRSSQTVFYVTLQWDYLNETDAGTIFDLYHDAAKANGLANTFRWNNYGEPSGSRHVYVVRFAEALARNIRPAGSYGYASVKLKILGRIAD